MLGHVDFTKVKAHEPDAASAYVEAMRQAMLNFCTCGHDAPGVDSSKQRFDQDLFSHLQRSHEALDCDAGSTIQAAGEIMTNALLDNPEALLPHTKVLFKDVTHAARRILSRPWEAIEALKEVFDTIIMGNASVVQRIRKSEALQRLLQKTIGATASPDRVELARIKNMSNAKGRFDSMLRPLIRFIVFFDEMCALSKQVSVLKSGDDIAKDFMNFAFFVSGRDGLVRALLLGFCLRRLAPYR